LNAVGEKEKKKTAARLGVMLKAMLLVLLCVVGVQAAFRVDPKSSAFIGADGRRHIFHGVNVVEKTHYFIPGACPPPPSLFNLDH
jgi:hypothetical protein